MRIQVNGNERELEDGATVLALIESLELTSDRVAIEVNRELVTRARHAETSLTDGDRVEIVTLVGGG